MIEIKLVEQQKERFLPLLLLADPSEVMIANYLDGGALYVLYEDGVPACVAVVTDYAPGACELKNLATDPVRQNRGHAGRMLRFLFETCAARYNVMYLGTSEQMIPYYTRFGFVPSHTVPNFFVDFYPEPIFEDGVQCVDMFYLKRPLGQSL